MRKSIETQQSSPPAMASKHRRSLERLGTEKEGIRGRSACSLAPGLHYLPEIVPSQHFELSPLPV